MNREEKADLRDLRDATTNEDDKKLLRKTVNYISALETRLFTVRVHARSIINETHNKSNDGED
jgi:hypothetical protein